MQKHGFSESATKQFKAVEGHKAFVVSTPYGDVRESNDQDHIQVRLQCLTTDRYGGRTIIVRDYMNNIVYQDSITLPGDEMAKKPTMLLYNTDIDGFLISDKPVNGMHDVTDSEDAKRAAGLMGIINLPINPDTLAKSGSEHGEQCALFCWLNYMAQWYPMLDYVYANANGGSRGDTDKSRKIEGGKMKAEGVKPGAPDVTVPIPRKHVGRNTLYPGMFIEMKRVDGGDGGSKEQHDWADYLRSQHYHVVFCNGWKEAVAALRDYLEI